MFLEGLSDSNVHFVVVPEHCQVMFGPFDALLRLEDLEDDAACSSSNFAETLGQWKLLSGLLFC